MIGAIIGAVASVGSAIAGGIKGARANRKLKKAIEDEKAENTAWYNRRYNEDPLARSDTQRILNRTQEAIRRNNQTAQAQQAVVGGSEESVAATKQANAQALASAASSISANNDARKDEVESQYRTQQANLNSQKRGLQAQHAQNVATQTSNALNAVSKIASSLDSADVGGTDKGAKQVKAYTDYAYAHKVDTSKLEQHARKQTNSAYNQHTIFDLAELARKNSYL